MAPCASTCNSHTLNVHISAQARWNSLTMDGHVLKNYRKPPNGKWGCGVGTLGGMWGMGRTGREGGTGANAKGCGKKFHRVCKFCFLCRNCTLQTPCSRLDGVARSPRSPHSPQSHRSPPDGSGRGGGWDGVWATGISQVRGGDLRPRGAYIFSVAKYVHRELKSYTLRPETVTP
jgi:hypothetical protein